MKEKSIFLLGLLKITRFHQKSFCVYSPSHSTCLSRNILGHWKEIMIEKGIESPEVSIKEINKYVQKFDCNLQEQTKLFEKLCKQRIERTPLQYIIGEWDFRYLNLQMKPPVFIPRPETESLIEYINEYLMRPNNISNFIEIGCGSGAISLSLLHENPQLSAVAIDKLKDAVDLTQTNAERFELKDRINVQYTDIKNFKINNKDIGKFDMLVSNPPYIPTNEIKTLHSEVKDHESMFALDGGQDGLDTFREILHHSRFIMNNNSSLWFELSEQHPKQIPDVLKDFPMYKLMGIYKDCYNVDRFVNLRYVPE